MESILLMILTVVIASKQTSSDKLIDLSYDLAPDSVRWPIDIPFRLIQKSKGYRPNQGWYEKYDVEFAEHTSTHMDAPNHFAYGRLSVDQIPLEDLFAPAVVIDMQEKSAEQPNAVLTTDDVMQWLDDHGPIPDGAVVFVRTGWGNRYSNVTQYLGTDTKDINKLAFPGISVGAAQLLTGYQAVSGRRVVGVAIDTVSLDPGNSTDFAAHREFADNNIYGIENVANMEALPIKGATVTVLPLKIRNGSGGPCRVVAKLPSSSASSAKAASSVPLALALLSLYLLHSHYI